MRPTSVHQLPGDSRTVQTAARTNRRHALQQSTSLPELPGRPASGTAAWEKTRWRTTQEDRTAATRGLPTLTPSIDGTQLSSRALEYKRWDGNQARDDLYHKYSVPKLGTNKGPTQPRHAIRAPEEGLDPYGAASWRTFCAHAHRRRVELGTEAAALKH